MRAATAIPLVISLLALAPATGQSRVADWLPDRCAGVIQVYEPGRLLAPIRTWIEQQVEDQTMLARQIEANQELTQARIVALGLAASAGVDIWEALAALLGDEIALGIAPGSGKGPAVGLIVRWENKALAERLLDAILALAQVSRTERTTTIADQQCYRLENDGHLCRVDGHLVIANSREAMLAILETRAGQRTPITRGERFRAGLQQVPGDAVASLYTDLVRLRPLLDRGRDEPGKLREAFPAFLFGGWDWALRHSPGGVAWARLTDDALVLEAHLPGETPRPATHVGFTQPGSPQRVWQARDLPRYLAELRIARDWSALFREREALLTLSGVSDANNFATTVSNLFGGLDFVNEVLPHIGGPTRLVIADQLWPADQPIPVPRLPAFALVAPLKPDAPQSLRARLFSAGQMALSLINFDAAQKGEVAYLLDIDRHADTRMVFTTFADYSEAGMQMDPVADTTGGGDDDAPAEVSIRYNFRPAVTIVEDQVVIATSDTLARDIIDRVRAAPQGRPGDPDTRADDVLDLDGQALVRILRANHRELVINRMLEEDQSRADATRDIDIILELLDQVAGLNLRVRALADGYRGTLSLPLRSAR